MIETSATIQRIIIEFECPECHTLQKDTTDPTSFHACGTILHYDTGETNYEIYAELWCAKCEKHHEITIAKIVD